MSWRYVIIVCSTLALIPNVEMKAKQRKFNLSWGDIVGCPDYQNQVTDMSNMEVYMVNETTMGIKGIINLKDDIDPPISVKAVVEKKVNGDNYMILITYDLPNLCEKIEDEGKESWSIYFKNLDPSITSCPLKKGNYDVSKISPDKADVELKKDMVGAYRSKIELFQTPAANGISVAPKPWACYVLQFNIDMV